MRSLLISVQRNLNIIGLKLLHQMLLDREHDSHLLYLIRFDPETVAAMDFLKTFVLSLNPKLIGISLTSSEFDAATELTKLLRGWVPDTIILWGGVHPTIEPEACAGIADYACIGEGEQTMLDVAEAVDTGRDLRHINNIAWMEEGQLHKNPLHPLIEDLDQLPPIPRIPANAHIQVHAEVETLNVSHLRKYRLFRGSLYRMITSRGCPFHCTYCCNNYYHRLYPNWRMRYHSAARVIQELETALASHPPIEYVSFMDDCFFSSKLDRFTEICTQYKVRIGKPFMMKAAPHFVTEERMKIAVDAGLVFLHVGLQSGSERICKEVFKRTATPKVFMKAAEIISKFRIVPWYDVILDNPFETFDENLEMVRILMTIKKPFYLQACSLTFYAGTEIRDEALRVFPELIEDPTQKDFLNISSASVNRLKTLAVTLPTPIMLLLVNAYSRRPNSSSTRFLILLGRLLSGAFFKPYQYSRILIRSQRGSFMRTMRALPYWIDRRAISVFNVFHRGKDDSTEE